MWMPREKRSMRRSATVVLPAPIPPLMTKIGAGSASGGGFDDTVLALGLDAAVRELLVVEAGVGSLGGQELGVRAALDDLAALHEQDLVGRQDGGEPVRDGDRRASLDEGA